MFVSTVFITMLHLVEWFHIRTLPCLSVGNSSSGVSSKLLILKGELGIEMVHCFLLMVGFAVFFSEELLFLTLIALLGVLHLVAFQSLLMLTTRRIRAVLLFHVAELVELGVLAVQFHPFSRAIV